MPNPYYKRVVELANDITSTWNPKMKWMWGEALLGYALSKLDEYQKTEDYTAFLKAYCDYYVENPPRVDQSDTVAPGLITYQMQKKFGNESYKKLTDRVLHYIRYEPRLIEDSVNHLGNSPEGKLYPKSIWVDSLMMFSVFPSLYAKEQNDSDMMTIAARQPRIMSKYMQDQKTHLWYHCYWVKAKRHYPRKIFWGRGNGWVVASLPMILENIGDHVEKENIIKIFKNTCDALLPYQRKDGTFETVINKVNQTYRELSFTALVASGFIHGYRLGILDQTFLDAGKKAFEAVVDSFIEENNHLYMPEISGPTIPMPIFPYLGYKWIPKGKNWSYGIAAVIFAAIQYNQVTP
jgi:unsaturated rhamnogalacturonyl hydrolase